MDVYVRTCTGRTLYIPHSRRWHNVTLSLHPAQYNQNLDLDVTGDFSKPSDGVKPRYSLECRIFGMYQTK